MVKIFFYWNAWQPTNREKKCTGHFYLPEIIQEQLPVHIQIHVWKLIFVTYQRECKPFRNWILRLCDFAWSYGKKRFAMWRVQSRVLAHVTKIELTHWHVEVNWFIFIKYVMQRQIRHVTTLYLIAHTLRRSINAMSHRVLVFVTSCIPKNIFLNWYDQDDRTNVWYCNV